MFELDEWHRWIRPSSIIYLSSLSAATALLNGFTLFVIYKDPLKCFRAPLKKHFIKTFMMNLIIGLVGEPLIALGHSKATFDVRVHEFGLVAWSIAIAQLFAIDAMDIYQPLFAKRLLRVFLVSFGTDLATLTLVFSNREFIHALGLLLYGEVNLIILIIILIANYKAFHGRDGLQAAALNDEFFKGTIIITLFLITTALPFLLSTMININLVMNGNHSSNLVGIILSDIMLLKFVLDPLVFIFLVPIYYRRAVRIVCVECDRVDDEDDDATIKLYGCSKDEGTIYGSKEQCRM